MWLVWRLQTNHTNTRAEHSARSSDKKALLLGILDLFFLWSLLGALLEVGRVVKLVRVLFLRSCPISSFYFFVGI